MTTNGTGLNIVYYGGGWPTNIGNAFIDIGSMHLLRRAAPAANISFASEMSRWTFDYNGHPMNNAWDPLLNMKADVAVVSGMVCCDEFVRVQGPVLKELVKRRTKIIMSGVGGLTYSEQEVNSFREFLKDLPLAGFVSRDRESFNNFGDVCEVSYDGIDCGFFLTEAFRPSKMIDDDYVVFNFDARAEPAIQTTKRVVKAHHAITELLQTKAKRSIIERKFSSRPISPGADLRSPSTMISDIPEDYLNLYANAKETYSDRVHAVVATLSFGKAARLYSESKRAGLFQRVDAAKVHDELTSLDMQRMKVERESQVAFLKNVIGGL